MPKPKRRGGIFQEAACKEHSEAFTFRSVHSRRAADSIEPLCIDIIGRWCASLKADGEVPAAQRIVPYPVQEADREEYLDFRRINGLVKNYSQFISFPIYTWVEELVDKEVPDEDAPVEEVRSDVQRSYL